MTEAIYITIGSEQIKKNGYRKYFKDFEQCDGDEMLWFYRMAIKPKKEFVWVYLVIGNKVRWRARFLEFAENQTIHFINGKSEFHKCWMVLFDFEKLPRPYEHKKGFQGFRYKRN